MTGAPGCPASIMAIGFPTRGTSCQTPRFLGSISLVSSTCDWRNSNIVSLHWNVLQISNRPFDTSQNPETYPKPAACLPFSPCKIHGGNLDNFGVCPWLRKLPYLKMTIGCLLANPIRFQRISAFLGRGQDKTGWKSTHFLKPGSASQVLRQLILMKKKGFSKWAIPET